MGIFVDDFERANGAPGGNWVPNVANVQVSNGYLISNFGQYWSAYNTTLSDGGRHECAAVVTLFTANETSAGPIVKTNGTLGYRTMITYAAGVYTLRIMKGSLLAGSIVASLALPYAPTGIFTSTLVWDAGVLTATISGFSSLTFNDATYTAYGWMGLAGLGSYSPIASVRMVTGVAPLFSVTPSPLGNFGACVPITLTGSNTNWTPGTPGSPTFTVDHGTLASQTVLTATTATASYCPGNFLGTATFTDPSTSATAMVLVTSDPAIVPPAGAYQFTPQAVNMVNETAGEGWLERLLKPTTPIATTAEASLELETALGNITLNTAGTVTPTSLPNAPLLYTVWRLLNGGYDAPTGPQIEPAFSSIDAGLALVKGQLEAIATPAQWNLAELLYSLGGNPIVSHQDILDALSGIGGGSNQDVLDAIAAAQGDPLATIKAVLDLVYSIRTTSNYDLADVLSAIAGLPHTDAPSLTPVLNKLTQIQPSALVSLSTILDAMVGANTITNIVNVALAALAGRAGSTVSGVIDLIGDLSSQVAAIAPVAAPLWPGVANARVSERVTLVDGLVVEGPLKGLLVDITSTPSGAAAYIFGDVNSWKHSGGVIFQSDEGAYERAESLGLESQIIVPKTMEIAARAIFRTYTGWQGSVRAWNSGPLTQ